MSDTLYIFDIDGTLTDSVPMYLMSVTKAMQALNIIDIDTDYNNYKHHTDSYALRYNYERNFDKSVPVDLLDEFEHHLIVAMNEFDPVKEIKGAKNLINHFKDHQIPFCFATGALPKPAFLKLDQCDIWYDERLLATSKTHESREGFVMDAIERAKSFYDTSGFAKIVSLGDGLWDLKTAQNLSLDFIGIGEKNREKLMDNGATQCYPNLEDFLTSLI
ncbi:HAD family hydrolase [Aquimarina litoralis]|uniref:HAD family hydrolase n=1 Tax=Aquimarina litoralis TaxID=584605 RepID=UPI001C583052|nr:HAD family hydrolase [Aquimarina litoralis]MBW1294103.1 HAD hydrolase-like protein [Aquimarina litoralis]